MPLPKRLLDGYASFRSGRYASEAARYERLGQGSQKPSMMIIACCDSRAAPETIFDAGPGEIFVVRNVANLVPPYMPDGGHHATSAALEFAVLALSVKHVVVMGHGRCGGIHAAVQDTDPLTHTDFIGSWMRGIKDVARYVTHDHSESEELFERRIERASVEHSLANMRTFPWIRMRENAGQLSIHGAWFDISLGELHAYDETAKGWSAITVGQP
jgi:carbonic anhydrase